MKSYRLLAIRKLSLKRGYCFIELGSGTGLKFPFLMEQIGPKDRVVKIDLIAGMLGLGAS